jgi:CRISPR system Cascade subunit CasD
MNLSKNLLQKFQKKYSGGIFMAVLILRLAAPLQSWGTSKFDDHRTEREPTKSGVIGMIAAAIGIRRWEDQKIEELSKLAFGVKVISAGKILTDFQMVHSIDFWNNSKDPNVNKTNRYYLADAIFAVGLEGDRELLEKIDYALKHPYFPLYLGRKSCPPAGQVVIGIKEGDLITALSNYSENNQNNSGRILIETEKGGYSVKDVPITFNRVHRKYASRQVIPVYPKEHDAFGETEV